MIYLVWSKIEKMLATVTSCLFNIIVNIIFYDRRRAFRFWQFLLKSSFLSKVHLSFLLIPQYKLFVLNGDFNNIIFVVHSFIGTLHCFLLLLIFMLHQCHCSLSCWSIIIYCGSSCIVQSHSIHHFFGMTTTPIFYLN